MNGPWLRKLALLIGKTIRDAKTQEVLGRAFVLPCLRGGISVLGYTGRKPLRPTLRGQNRLAYWKQELVFEAARDADFASKFSPLEASKNQVALALLSHQAPEMVQNMSEKWDELTAPTESIVAYGGTKENFAQLGNVSAVYIEESRLRTRDHQREFQTYTQVLARCVEALQDKAWDWLCFAEFDVIPLNENLFADLVKEAREDKADVLMINVLRVDDTLHPHYAAHIHTSDWLNWLETFSTREQKDVVLSCLGCVSLWRREAIEDLVKQGEPVAAYLELQLPTVAHHLGYRVRSMKSHQDWMNGLNLDQTLDDVKNQGAKMLHPIKDYWISDKDHHSQHKSTPLP